MEKQDIISFFDSSAGSWDEELIRNDKVIEKILDNCGIDKGVCVLDVACGTGDFTIEIAKKTASGSEIVGVDISEGMIAVGREKIAKSGVEASMSVADCEALPYADNTFDRISVGFGVRNFEHLELGLSEMCRVLKPGGKAVVLELSVPSNAFIRWCYKLYFLKILPFIGGLVSGERSAYEYLPASVLRFPAPEKFIEIMKSSGFDTVEHTPLTLGICRMYVGEKADK